jgi:ATP-binding cassette, subfamily C, bacterial
MLNRQSTELISHFIRAYPRRSAVIVILLFLSGFAEGIGIVTLLPVLELAIAEPGADESAIMALTRGALATVGMEPSLGVLLTFVIGGMFLKGAFLWLAFRQVGYTVAQVATDLRLSLIRALLRARWGYFLSQRAGHLSNAIGTEARRASQAYSAACNLAAGFIQVLIYIGLAVLIAPLVAGAAIVGGALTALVFSRMIMMGREAGQQQTKLAKSLSGRLVDALHSLKPIKAMAQENHLRPVLEAETRALNEAQRREVLASSTMKAFKEPLLVFMLGIGLYILLSVTTIPFAGLLVMVFLFHRLVGQINSLQFQWKQIAVSESAFWSLRESVEHATREREHISGGKAAPALSDAIEVREVTFGYTEQPVLQDVSLTIPAGNLVAIFGPSGSGKTTLVDLLIGLYRPQAGRILIDGTPLDGIDLAEWRRQLGYVPQEMLLFHDTLLHNITLGDETIDRREVEKALLKAEAWGFVSALPQGLDTVIGAQGAMLSGGQRQRVAIARALVRRPKLLILDEVTTALDPATEAEICRTLSKLKGDVTIVAISHQAAITEVADITYKVTHGSVEEMSASSSPAIAISR